MEKKTLVVIAHDSFGDSRINKALMKSVRATGATIRILEESFDVKAEHEALEACDELILQFPLQWFSVPARMKSWIDAVFSADFAYGRRFALEGKKASIITSLGGKRESYQVDGIHGHVLEDFLLPLRATFAYAKMEQGWTMALYGVYSMSDAELAEEAAEYARKIRD